METLFWRLLFSDWQTLRDYLERRPVDLDHLKRRLFINERALDYRSPDHYLKNIRDYHLQEVRTVQQIVTVGLRALSDHFLRQHGDRLVVTPEHFASWQHHVPRFSPLVVVSFGIFARFGGPGRTREERQAYTERYLVPQFRASALPTVADPALDDLIRHDGLSDLHIHLNGSTEVDKIWQDALLRPEDFLRVVLAGRLRDEVKEQYAQIEPSFQPSDLEDRIYAARRLRMAIAETVLLNRQHPEGCLAVATPGFPESEEFEERHRLDRHPVDLFEPLRLPPNDLIREALWLITVFDYLATHPNADVAMALHAYLLLLGNFIPLCVQQPEQFGFDQFQKITWNEVREMSEQEYRDRFEQISYSLDGDLVLVEGRFAPKNRYDKAVTLFERIFAGFSEFHGHAPGTFDMAAESEVECRRRLDLRLVAHFIKRDDPEAFGDPNSQLYVCRFRPLRLGQEREFQMLMNLRERFPAVKHYLTGIDAASNELHTPPEVFAPLFRACRRAGFVHFTYHVGEDFEHLLGGIRAIYEALTLLELGPGNRIGHGTAIGVEPSRWRMRCKTRMVRRKGDWLDDLVFAHHQLMGYDGGGEQMARLRQAIAPLAADIYGQTIDPADLWAAAQLRGLDPIVAFDPTFDIIDSLDNGKWEEARLVNRVRAANPRVFALFRRYNMGSTVVESRKPIVVDTSILDDAALRHLQDKVLEEIVRRRCVIESLPTSNVRISVYEDYPEHHLFRWLGLNGDKWCPPICLGTDDPGIFATNLRNEYAHLLRELRDHFQLSDERALSLIRSLNDNGRIYAFR